MPASAAPSPTVPPSEASSARPETLVVEVGPARLSIWVVDTPEARAAGLSGYPSMPRDWGMWFDMGRTAVAVFWMKGMRFPLDIVWIDADWRVIQVTHEASVPSPDASDQELPRYSAGSVPVRYVLEINAGVARELGIGPGQQARILGLASPSGD